MCSLVPLSRRPGSRPGAASSTDPHTRRPPGWPPGLPPDPRPGPGGLAPRPAGPLGGQRLPAVGRQRPPPPVRRHPRHPQPPRDLTVAGPGLDHLGHFQPHLFPASPLHRGQPAATGVPHDTGITQTDDARQPRQPSRLKFAPNLPNSLLGGRRGGAGLRCEECELKGIGHGPFEEMGVICLGRGRRCR
jgi:hypothetical protein